MNKTFRYGKSYKIMQWGCCFDSLLELKYAMAIRDEYEFIRFRMHIYYDQRTLKPTDYIRTGIKRYTPDFLIRHKQTHKAWLVEIKPRAFNNHTQLRLRQQVAENFIRWKKYDWTYKVVYDDEIILDEEGLAIFEDCSRLKSKTGFRIWMQEQNRRYDRSAPLFFSTRLDPRQAEWVMYGHILDRNPS